MSDLDPALARTAVNTVVREDWGRMLSILVAQVRDLELAEDCLQDAVVSALVHWPDRGIPEHPVAWLIQTARRKGIDRLRRVTLFARKEEQITLLAELERAEPDEDGHPELPDERLRLIFTCAHPALPESARVPLTLHTLCGLSAQEVASAFLTSEPTLRQRLVRAKRKIRATAIPYRVPEGKLLIERLTPVLKVIYLIFNEGYRSNSGVSLIRTDLCEEAMRLCDLLIHCLPEHAETLGLQALMQFHHSRYLARIDAQGESVSLSRQDRGRWLEKHIERGDQLLLQATRLRKPGPYQIQAAISAVHASAATFEETDWAQIVLLYDRLYACEPTPVVLINRAVALSHAVSPVAGLACLGEIADDAQLQSYQPYFAARADLHKRADNRSAARNDFLKAIALSQNREERRFLEQQLSTLDD